MILTLFIIGWVLCGIVSYFLARKICRDMGSHMWTQGIRICFIAASTFGPLALIVHSIMWVLSSEWGEEEAKW